MIAGWCSIRVYTLFVFAMIHLSLNWRLVLRPACWRPLSHWPYTKCTRLIIAKDLIGIGLVWCLVQSSVLCVQMLRGVDQRPGRQLVVLGMYGVSLFSYVILDRGPTRHAQTTLNTVAFVIGILYVVRTARLDAHQFYAASVNRLVVRMVLAVIASDYRQIAIPECAISITNIAMQVVFARNIFASDDSIASYIVAEAFPLTSVWAVCLMCQNFDNACKDAGISTIEANAVKRLLSVLCDADVHLNADLHIMGPCNRLSSFLGSTQPWDDLNGMRFSTVLAPEDRLRFEEFIKVAPPKQDSLMTGPANLIHVCLAPADNTPQDVKIVHVQAVGFDGTPSHILGITFEDPLDYIPGANVAPARISTHTDEGQHITTVDDMTSDASSEAASTSTLSNWTPVQGFDRVIIGIDPFVSNDVEILDVMCEGSETGYRNHLMKYIRGSHRSKFSTWLHDVLFKANLHDSADLSIREGGLPPINDLQLKIGDYYVNFGIAMLQVNFEDDGLRLELALGNISFKPFRVVSSQKLGKQSAMMPSIHEPRVRQRKCG